MNPEGPRMSGTSPPFGDDQLTRDLIEVISKEGMVDMTGVTPQTTLASLNIASVDYMMILAAVEEKFSVYIPMDESMAEVTDVGGLLAVLKQRILAAKKA